MQTETDKIGFSLFFYYKTIDTFSLDNQFYFHIQKLKYTITMEKKLLTLSFNQEALLKLIK